MSISQSQINVAFSASHHDPDPLTSELKLHNLFIYFQNKILEVEKL